MYHPAPQSAHDGDLPARPYAWAYNNRFPTSTGFTPFLLRVSWSPSKSLYTTDWPSTQLRTHAEAQKLRLMNTDDYACLDPTHRNLGEDAKP
jgi:hypothetical protein